MVEYNRELTISWLESNQNNGVFNGFPEEIIDFKNLDDEELSWYYENWAYDDMNEEME